MLDLRITASKSDTKSKEQKGHFLVAVNGPMGNSVNQSSVSIWELTAPHFPFSFREGFGSRPFYISPTARWLVTDDGVDKFKFIHLEGGVAPTLINVDLDEFKQKQTWKWSHLSAFSGDERWFVRFNERGEAVVWGLSKLTPAFKTPHLLGAEKTDGRKMPVAGTFLPDSKHPRLVLFFRDGSMRTWRGDGEQWQQAAQDEQIRLPEKAEIVDVAINRTGSTAVLVPRAAPPKKGLFSPPRGSAYSMDLTKTPKVARECKDWGSSTTYAVDDTGRFLYGAYYKAPSHFLRIWDLLSESKDPIEPTKAEEEFASPSFASVPFSSSVVARETNNAVKWIDLRTPQSLPLRGHDALVTTLAFSSEGRLLATGSNDGTVRVWNLNPLSPHSEPREYRAPSKKNIVLTENALALSLPDGALRVLRIGKTKTIEGNPVRYHPEYRPQRDAYELHHAEQESWLLQYHPKSPVVFLWDLKRPDAKKPSATFSIKPVQGALRAVHTDGTWVALQFELESPVRAVYGAPESEQKAVALVGRLMEDPKERFNKIYLEKIPGKVVLFAPKTKQLLIQHDKRIDEWVLKDKAVKGRRFWQPPLPAPGIEPDPIVAAFCTSKQAVIIHGSAVYQASLYEISDSKNELLRERRKLDLSPDIDWQQVPRVLHFSHDAQSLYGIFSRRQGPDGTLPPVAYFWNFSTGNGKFLGSEVLAQRANWIMTKNDGQLELWDLRRDAEQGPVELPASAQDERGRVLQCRVVCCH